MTFGKVSSRAKTSSLRISPRAILEENCSSPSYTSGPEVTDLAARRQLIIRRTLISSSVKLLGESPYRPVATVKECPGLKRACAIAWVPVAAPPPRDNQNAHSLGQWTAYRETRFVSAHLFKT